jgi:hypothetical protein
VTTRSDDRGGGDGRVGDDDGESWRFGDDDIEAATDAIDASGARASREPIEPEPLDPENALFVLVGVVGTILLLVGGV